MFSGSYCYQFITVLNLLEATCFPNLSWETWDSKGSLISWDLKGSLISMTLASPLGGRNPSSQSVKAWTVAQFRQETKVPTLHSATVALTNWFVKQMCHHAWWCTFHLQECNMTQEPPLLTQKIRAVGGNSWSRSPAFTLSRGFWLLQGLEPHLLPHFPTSVTAC